MFKQNMKYLHKISISIKYQYQNIIEPILPFSLMSTTSIIMLNKIWQNKFFFRIQCSMETRAISRLQISLILNGKWWACLSGQCHHFDYNFVFVTNAVSLKYISNLMIHKQHLDYRYHACLTSLQRKLLTMMLNVTSVIQYFHTFLIIWGSQKNDLKIYMTVWPTVCVHLNLLFVYT